MKRKTIGVCVSGYNKAYEYKVISGIYDECQKNNYNLLIFSSVMPKEDLSTNSEDMINVIKGESEIFNLINYKKIDGLVVFGESLPTLTCFENIVQRCKENNIPLVDVGDVLHTTEHNVTIQNVASMELIVEHLVTVHKFTKINYIGGIPDNKESEERLQAYKNVLAKYKIPVEPQRISYGYFWKQAEECVKDFLRNGDLPEAIVCANDSMAFFAMDYLKNNGYSIPEDIVVTGYDGTPDADKYSPSITTIRPDFYEAGIKSFNLLQKVMNGENPEDSTIDAVLCVQESCGCKKKQEKGKSVVYNYLDDNYSQRHDILNFSTELAKMNLVFAKADNSYSLFNALAEGLNTFNFKKIYICVCSDLERQKEFFYKDSMEQINYGISKNMVSVVRSGHEVPVGTNFSSEDMLPENLLEEEKPSLVFFSPMYFRDRFLGYTAYEPESLDFPLELFLVWLQTASNDVGSFYVKNELENMYIRDPLTGLYNRRGMSRMFYKTFTEAKDSKQGSLILFCADIDYLKAINDTYGHEAGDNAILKAADAIRMGLPKNSICVRTGGDEFCMLIYMKSEPDVKQYIKEINKYLETYNEKSNLPYRVQVSIGYCIKMAEEEPGIQDMQRIADKNLYVAKENRSVDKKTIIQKFED